MAKDPAGKDSPLAQRMRRVRAAMHPDGPKGSASAFADWLGVERNRWFNVENGHPLGRELAMIVRNRIPGMSLDYLLHGDPGHLSVDLAERLGELPPRSKAHHGRS